MTDVIRAVFFDMGNVLIHFSHERMCHQIAAVSDVDQGRVQEILFAEGLELSYESGQLTTEAFHQQFQKMTGSTIDLDTFIPAFCDIFWLNESMIPVLDALRTTDIPLLLLSNVSPIHFQWITERFPLIHNFDHYVLSYEQKACKPDARIFHAAVRQAGIPARNCFFTDDIGEYVEAARGLDIDAVKYTGAPSLCKALRRRGLNF